MKPLILILLLAFTVSAQKIQEGKSITNWVPVSAGVSKDPRVQGNIRAELSFANVQRSDNAFKGWARFVFPNGVALEGNWKEARFYVVCDCRKNVIKALTGIAFGVDGTIRAEESKRIMEHTTPGSIGREMFQFFCERGGPATTAPTLKP